MKKINKIIFDFDETYKNVTLDKDVLVFTDSYNKESVINVSNGNKYWKNINDEFENTFCYHLNCKLESIIDLTPYKKHFFTGFFYPLGKWLCSLNDVLSSYNRIINENCVFEFTSFSNNKKLFLINAEHEPTNQFLYKKSYFLSFYIREYIKLKGFTKIVIRNDYSRKSRLSFAIRGFLILAFKVLSLLIYKLFTRRRFRLDNKIEKRVILFSTRGVIQTQFLDRLMIQKNNKFALAVNESTMKPFLNHKLTKKYSNTIYCEGLISYKDLYAGVIDIFKSYTTSNTIKSVFYGVQVDFYDLIQEYSILSFHTKSYARSIENAINCLEKTKKIEVISIVNLDMLQPFAYYLKLYTCKKVFQVQAASMISLPYPNFVYGDKFYFTDFYTYESFKNLKLTFDDKFGYLKSFKYLGVSPSDKIDKVSKITFFTQPIYLHEELYILKILQKFCKMENIQLRVKLHPRCDSSNYKLADLVFVDKNTNAIQEILYTDLAVTRTSTIGMDCWILNTPIIFFVNMNMKNDNSSYIPNDYKGTIKFDIDEYYLKDNLELILKDFYSITSAKNKLVHSGEVDELEGFFS